MIRLIFIIALTAVFSIPMHAQFWKRKINQTDENGKKHGFWVEYLDSEHVDISGKGKWKFYDDKRRLQKVMLYEDGIEKDILYVREAE